MIGSNIAEGLFYAQFVKSYNLNHNNTEKVANTDAVHKDHMIRGDKIATMHIMLPK